MDKCPKCGTWSMAYFPQREEHQCFECGFKQHEEYSAYLKRENCSKYLTLRNREMQK